MARRMTMREMRETASSRQTVENSGKSPIKIIMTYIKRKDYLKASQYIREKHRQINWNERVKDEYLIIFIIDRFFMFLQKILIMDMKLNSLV